MLITLADAARYVRQDSSDDDTLLNALIEAASDMVVNYLGENAESWLASTGEPHEDSNGNVLYVPEAVKAAVRYLVGWMYRNRDADPDQAWQPGYLPAPVTAMLYPLRDPTLA